MASLASCMPQPVLRINLAVLLVFAIGIELIVVASIGISTFRNSAVVFVVLFVVKAN